MLNATDIVTTSQDQTVSLWTLEEAYSGTMRLRQLETQFVHVPDPSTMDVLASTDGSGHTVAIAGIGLQVFEISEIK